VPQRIVPAGRVAIFVKRLARLFLIAGLAAGLAACSLTRIAYTNATPLIAWNVDDWFDLQPGQKDWLRDRVGRLMAWHRASELPEYRRFLQEVLVRSEDGVSEEDARWAYVTMRGYYRSAMERTLPDMAEFVRQLDAAQAAHLEHRFAEENEKLVKESLKGTPAERRERRARRFIGHFEDWTGRLSAAQRELVATHLAAISEITDEWMGDRRLRQSETLALIRARPSQEEAIAALRRILVDADSWRRPEYAAKLKERDRRVFALVGALGATLTQGQREHFAKRVQGYLHDITHLMAAG
jgi:hypothetical protein